MARIVTQTSPRFSTTLDLFFFPELICFGISVQASNRVLLRHYIEALSALLTLCEGIHRSPVNSPPKWPVVWNYMFFIVRLRKLCRWFETSWDRYNVNEMCSFYFSTMHAPHLTELHRTQSGLKKWSTFYKRHFQWPHRIYQSVTSITYRQTFSFRRTKSKNLNIFLSSCSYLCIIHSSPVFSRE